MERKLLSLTWKNNIIKNILIKCFIGIFLCEKSEYMYSGFSAFMNF